MSDDTKPEDIPQKQWGMTSADFAERAAKNRGRIVARSVTGDPFSGDSIRELKTGRITWRPAAVDFDLVRRSTTERSLFRLQKSLPELIWNAAALEGNTFTLPQVQTLLDGVTVGGKKLEEAEQILSLSEGMGVMIGAVRDGTFSLSKDLSDRIHGIVARHEAIEAGNFRGEGADYANLLAALNALRDPRARALAYFASATRSQFYFDGNKRTARIMMTGALAQSGFEPVSIPYARQEEFNVALDELFRTDDGTRLIGFLATCTMRDAS